MSVKRARQVYHSPHPRCPDPYCDKIWAATREDAKRLHKEMQQFSGDRSPVRYYEHRGGWHWTRRINKDDA